MSIKHTVLIIVIIAATASAKQSKILNYIGNFVPSLTEIGILTNCVNVYDKVSNFVRATNKIVHSVGQAKSDWQRLRSNIEEIYEDINYLKNINPYDMDSWQEGLGCFSFSLRSNTSQAIEAFEMLDAHTIGATETYVQKVTSIADYKRVFEGKKEQISDIYHHSTYRKNLLNSTDAIREYRNATIARLRSLQSADLLIMQTTIDNDEYNQAQSHFEVLEEEIASLESAVVSTLQMEQVDSIIDQTSNLIAINLTEIKMCNETLEKMRRSASNMVSAYYRLTGENLNNQSANEHAELPPIIVDPENFDAQDPDKVAAPMTPSIPKRSISSEVKNVSNHDILSLHNAAAFLALKQESLKRDILAMKTNTMAFIVSMEAFRRNKTELAGVALAHNYTMIEIALEDLQ